MFDASNLVPRKRQGCPKNIAFTKGWFDRDHLAALTEPYNKNDCGRYLTQLLK